MGLFVSFNVVCKKSDRPL